MEEKSNYIEDAGKYITREWLENKCRASSSLNQGVRVLDFRNTIKFKNSDPLISRETSLDDLHYDGETIKASFKVLNFLEEMAISIRKGLADEVILKQIFKKSLISVYEVMSSRIDKHMEISPDAYSSLKEIYIKWKNA